MKEVEEFVQQYFIDNNIPLKLKFGQSTVLMAVYGSKVAKCDPSTVTSFSKKWFKDKPKRINIANYILKLHELKFCTKCKKLLNLDKFYKRENNRLRSHCSFCLSKARKIYYNNNREHTLKVCSDWAIKNPTKVTFKSAKYRAAKLQRTPSWADLEKIKEFYLNCPEGYHVDHIIPLQGKNISGLHVENNLQYLTAEENLRKGNKWPYNLK